MTVFENIAFGLRVMPSKIRPNKEAIKNKVYELLNLVKMEELANRYPSQLSGGQRQRIALARHWRWSRRSCFWMNLLGHWMLK